MKREEANEAVKYSPSSPYSCLLDSRTEKLLSAIHFFSRERVMSAPTTRETEKGCIQYQHQVCIKITRDEE